LTDDDHSTTIPIHCASSDFTSYIIQPITLLDISFQFLLRTSPSLSPISHRLLTPSHVRHPRGWVTYRMMGETTVSPLLIGYSPINSACGTLLFSFSHPSCGLPITCLRVLVNYLAKQYSVLSLPSLCSPNRLQSPRHGIH